MIELYEIGIGLIVLSILLIFFALIIYFTNTFVHTWVLWVLVGLSFLILLGFFLLFLFYTYYYTYNEGTISIVEKKTIIAV